MNSAIAGVTLPVSINVNAFVGERAKAIERLKAALEQGKNGKRSFQKLHFSRRRRAQSHNPFRIPVRCRESMVRDLRRSPTVPSRRPRKDRRKPRSLAAEFGCRHARTAWLETHLWHSKRMHMANRFGFRLATSCTQKNRRRLFRLARRRSLMYDASYYSHVLLSGADRWQSLIDLLEGVDPRYRHEAQRRNAGIVEWSKEGEWQGPLEYVAVDEHGILLTAHPSIADSFVSYCKSICDRRTPCPSPHSPLYYKVFSPQTLQCFELYGPHISTMLRRLHHHTIANADAHTVAHSVAETQATDTTNIEKCLKVAPVAFSYRVNEGRAVASRVTLPTLLGPFPHIVKERQRRDSSAGSLADMLLHPLQSLADTARFFSSLDSLQVTDKKQGEVEDEPRDQGESCYDKRKGNGREKVSALKVTFQETQRSTRRKPPAKLVASCDRPRPKRQGEWPAGESPNEYVMGDGERQSDWETSDDGDERMGDDRDDGLGSRQIAGTGNPLISKISKGTHDATDKGADEGDAKGEKVGANVTEKSGDSIVKLCGKNDNETETILMVFHGLKYPQHLPSGSTSLPTSAVEGYIPRVKVFIPRNSIGRNFFALLSKFGCQAIGLEDRIRLFESVGKFHFPEHQPFCVSGREFALEKIREADAKNERRPLSTRLRLKKTRPATSLLSSAPPGLTPASSSTTFSLLDQTPRFFHCTPHQRAVLRSCCLPSALRNSSDCLQRHDCFLDLRQTALPVRARVKRRGKVGFLDPLYLSCARELGDEGVGMIVFALHSLEWGQTIAGGFVSAPAFLRQCRSLPRDARLKMLHSLDSSNASPNSNSTYLEFPAFSRGRYTLLRTDLHCAIAQCD